MEQEISWSYTLEENTIYAAKCSRDELMIIQSDDLEGANIVPRRNVELTAEDINQLERLDLPPESWYDDGLIMKARLDRDRHFTLVGVERNEHEKPLSKTIVLRKIQDMMKSTLKPGIGIRYRGPGKKGTGDWCFADGFITFREIAELYVQHFKGKLLFINSDCSYSGCWVNHCAEYFEEQGIKPCAHSAKENGLLISIKASCRSYEIPHKLYSAIRVSGNDKNTGVMWSYVDGWKAAEGQHVKQANALNIECENKSISDPCNLQPDVSWTRKVLNDRIFLTRGSNQGRPAWHYVLLIDDDETICKFKDLTQGENSGKHTINCSDYGQVLKSGWGENPPNEAKEWMQTNYFAS